MGFFGDKVRPGSENQQPELKHTEPEPEMYTLQYYLDIRDQFIKDRTDILKSPNYTKMVQKNIDICHKRLKEVCEDPEQKYDGIGVSSVVLDGYNNFEKYYSKEDLIVEIKKSLKEFFLEKGLYTYTEGDSLLFQLSPKETKFDYKTKRAPISRGFRNVVIHVNDPLSPYIVKNEQGQILENIWQFAKVYPEVKAQRIPVSRWKPNGAVMWEHTAGKHLVENVLTPEYFEWREKGMNNQYAVRYPVGFHDRHKCVFSWWNGERLDYIQARKKIYCGEYKRLIQNDPAFLRLKERLDSGENLQIAEVDGPDHTLTFPPYDRLGPTEKGLTMDYETTEILLNDTRKPFGHGYTIAALLLGYDSLFET